MSVTVGVDIGGSHVSCAGVNMENSEIIPGTFFRGPVNCKGNKENVLKEWAEVINRTLLAIDPALLIGISFAMPGPFNYNSGVALFERNDKYQSLYRVSVASELQFYLERKNLPLRFLNDASAFGIGSVSFKNISEDQKIIAITLGTGFGAAFLEDNIPLINGKYIPREGCLWNKPFLEGIADDYFSTRWFVSKYQELAGFNNLQGVKEIAAAENAFTAPIFKEFSRNLADFLNPYLKTFGADILVLGGSIAKAHRLFLSSVLQDWKKEGIGISCVIIENTEEINIIGASNLYKKKFWRKVGKKLPNL